MSRSIELVIKAKQILMILCLRKEEISGRFRRFKGKDSVLWGWRGRVQMENLSVVV